MAYIERYEIVKKNIKTIKKKLTRDIKEASSRNTIEAQLTETKRWPTGGLRQLSWVKDVANTGGQIIFQAYNKDLQVMICSAYRYIIAASCLQLRLK